FRAGWRGAGRAGSRAAVPHRAGGWREASGASRRSAMAKTSYAIAIGSNRRHGRHGGPPQVVEAALKALKAHGLKVKARSRVHRTPALGPAGREFANAAAVV